MISLLGIELAIRLTGKFKTYTESTGKSYTSYWGFQSPGWYWTHTPNTTYLEKNSEFSYQNKYNSFGHRELEPVRLFNTNSCRVVVLGDSYVEGVGVPYDSSLTRFLDNFASRDSIPVRFYNAGVAGSDPFYSYSWLRDHLTSLHPNLIIVAINPSDYSDYVFRGGFERFHSDGTTRFKEKPGIEFFFRYSHIVRLLMSANGYAGETFLRVEDYIQAQEKAHLAFLALADSFKTLATKSNTNLAFFLHPNRIQDLCNTNFNSKVVMTQLEYDLQKQHCKVFNVYHPMDSLIQENNMLQFGYPIDGHYNATGYQLMAQQLYLQLLENKMISKEHSCKSVTD
ncbi:MAG: SGNH/GDSL hydrolase family protein [Bacteroidia bacterium]|nr:SGNH/GDSL hydrolase family protein [Bacteroidia bacterium]